jgi:gluconolactonase
MSMFEVREIASGLQFPEGPVSLPDGSLLVTEVAAGRLVRVSQRGELSVVAELGGSAAGAAIGPDGRCYVCNGGGQNFKTRDGLTYPGESKEGRGLIQVVDLATGKSEVLYDACNGVELSAPNDLVFDQHEGFWFTDHGKVRASTVDRGNIYYAKADGSYIRRVVGPMDGPNGIGLSPDGKRLYVAETGPARIWAFDIDSPGTLLKSDSAEFRRMGHLVVGLGGYQLLDSLAVDAAGWICVATLLNGGITMVSADGRATEHVPLQDRFTTNVCFAADGAHRAYVTLASTGRLVSVEWPRSGAPLNH